MQLRADEALLSAGLCETIEEAKALIMEGKVLYGSERLMKASDKIKQAELLRIKGQNSVYVSRGAFKLKKAFEVFDISAQGKVCIDVGASTGGFTDIMLRQGASKVYCVDVGYNLLNWKIRSDPRVVVMEKTNARLLKPEMLPEKPSFGATDVSFISLKTILLPVFSILKEDSDFIALVKPQFEAAKESVGPKGVVRDKEVHIGVLKSILEFIHECGFSVYGLSFSPIKGPEGNIEFLVHIKKDGYALQVKEDSIVQTVCLAHDALC